MNNAKESMQFLLKKQNNYLNQNVNKPLTLEEYFILIGIEPKLSTKEFLYNNSLSELNEFFLDDDFKPKILSKFPPINKQYINLDSSLIDLCFPNGYKLEKFYSQPKPEILHFILDNSFYSINYPLKYVSCLKIYENLENYYRLKNEIKNKLPDDFFHNSYKANTGNNKKKEINNAIGNINPILSLNERLKTQCVLNVAKKKNNNNEEDYKLYYFPKVLCLVSTEQYFKEQKQILKQIYYYISEKKTRNIPIEKKILTILFNVPLPPKGLLEIQYKLEDNYRKIKLRGKKMNKLSSLEPELQLILSKFTINKLLIILRYILFETKTIIFSSNVNEISFFIYGIMSLLFPLHYSFQVASSVPNGLYDVLESISPYILGVNKKFSKNFFRENKIDIGDMTLFIIDLDGKSVKLSGENNIPDFPKSLYKPLHDGLEELLDVKNKKVVADKNEINFKEVRFLFFEFFINLLFDYDLYVNKDYFQNKLPNSGIKNLFRIKEFVDSHPNGEKLFYTKFTETQMFSDFIYKKMMPKNLNEKLEILFFDEYLTKKKNKKIFTKKRPTIFLDSKEYEHRHIYEIPKSQILSKKEKNFFSNEEDRNKLLFYGQKIIAGKNNNSNEEDYTFQYYVFPILNKSFYDSAPIKEYFLSLDSILFSDVDRANTDIISESMNINNSNVGNKKKTLEEEMLNYIYLTYIELWAYGYWYLDFSEKDNKFNQLLEILNKITHHEVELFDLLFEALNKSKETNKILQLYDFLLKYKISPSSFIYSTVNTILAKKRFSKSLSINIQKMNKDLENKKKNIKRTFHSMKEGFLLGDKVIFYSKQACPECDKEMNIADLSLNFKNTKKDIVWAKCPFCGQNIIPKLGVLLGSELKNNKNNKNDDSNDINYNNTSVYTKFILHSPYELKNNIKNIITKDVCSIFHLEHFKEKYPSLFWSCIWYFKINKIDFDIILPYEWNTIHNLNTIQNSIPMNLYAVIEKETEKENEKEKKNENEIKILVKKNKKLKKRKKAKIKKYTNDELIISSVISLKLNELKSILKIHSISSLFDYYRKSNSSSNTDNKQNKFNKNKKNVRGSAEMPKIQSDIIIQINKKNTVNTRLPYNFMRVRLNTLSKKEILSPSSSRKLFENCTNDLLSIKENEDHSLSSFEKDNEENDDNDTFFDGVYSNKNVNIFNFEENDVNNVNSFEYKSKRSHSTINKNKSFEIKDEGQKRNKSVENKKSDINNYHQD